MTIVPLFVLVASFSGCAQSHKRNSPEPIVDRRSDDRARASGPTSPSEGRNALVEAAMRGVRYRDGIAEVDPEIAPTIVPVPDVALFQTELAAAESLSANGDPIESLAGFTRAVIHDPAQVGGYEGLARMLLPFSRAAECAAACQSVLNRDPNRHDVRERMALASQMSGNFDLAAAAWAGLLERVPEHVEARGRLAVVHYFREDYAAAWTVLLSAEERGQPVPPQLRELLAEEMPEP